MGIKPINRYIWGAFTKTEIALDPTLFSSDVFLNSGIFQRVGLDVKRALEQEDTQKRCLLIEPLREEGGLNPLNHQENTKRGEGV